MRSAGLRPRGFVAPYGDWNESLARALADSDIGYSSEFGFAYDDLPSFPIVGGRRSGVLQVPVHPICLGLFRAARTNPEAVVRHYRDYIELQVARQEPCLLYDHPDAIERSPDVFQKVMATGVTAACATPTMTELATWWRRRLAAKWLAHGSREHVTIEVESGNSDLAVSVERPEGSASAPLNSDRLDYDALQFKPITAVIKSHKDELQARRLALRARLRFGARAVTKSLQERAQRL